MPLTPNRITVDPSGRSTDVTITNVYGDNAVTYSSLNGSSAVTFPDTITSATTYYLASGGDYTVSAEVDGVEVAGSKVSARHGVPVTVKTSANADALVDDLLAAVAAVVADVADHETRIAALEV